MIDRDLVTRKMVLITGDLKTECSTAATDPVDLAKRDDEMRKEVARGRSA